MVTLLVVSITQIIGPGEVVQRWAGDSGTMITHDHYHVSRAVPTKLSPYPNYSTGEFTGSRCYSNSSSVHGPSEPPQDVPSPPGASPRRCSDKLSVALSGNAASRRIEHQRCRHRLSPRPGTRTPERVGVQYPGLLLQASRWHLCRWINVHSCRCCMV